MLFHLSDLHIGDPVYVDVIASGPSGVEFDTRKPANDMSYRSHSYWTCFGLSNILLRQKKPLSKNDPRPDPAHVLVSGDLTRVGDTTEFENGHTFLGEGWPPLGDHGLVGLQLHPERKHLIPGNHDYWGGWLPKIPGLPPVPAIARVEHAIGAAEFPECPWVNDIVVKARDGSDAHFQIIGLDTVRAHRRWSLLQALAYGDVTQDQLDLASSILRERANPSAVRVAMVHHPPRAIWGEGEARLTAWLKQEGIQLLICGHTHEASDPRQLESGQAPWVVVAGTATQAGTATTMPGKESNQFFQFELISAEPVVIQLSSWRHTGFEWLSPQAREATDPLDHVAVMTLQRLGDIHPSGL